MSDYQPPKKNTVYEPGTLDQTRKNIGPIDQEEAKRMTKILGGEVFTEKSAPADLAALPKQPIQRHAHPDKTSKKGRTVPANPEIQKPVSGESEKSKAVPEKKSHQAGLPEISEANWQLMDHLMMSQEYRIKPNYGFFNFIRYLQKNGIYKIMPDFAETNLKRNIEHLQAFITIIKTLIQAAPKPYKTKIQQENDLKFRFLRRIAEWSLRELKLMYIDIEKNTANITVTDLIPYVREIYGILAQIMYLGETGVPQIIKEIYNDEIEYPDTDRKRITVLAKDGISEWIYLYTETIKGLYPLLMRMSGGNYAPFPSFFTANIKTILNFLGKTKYDLLFIEKEEHESVSIPHEQEAELNTESRQNSVAEPRANMELVKAGLSLLDALFPQAGFKNIETMPDLYPYFQPLFALEDGFNLLSPENPLQVVVVLLKILEDLFYGCRNIEFNFETSEYKSDKADTVSAVINDWSQYREMMFNKAYASVLSDFVNELYTQSDFLYSQYGKKLINKMLWLTKYHFLPYYKFEKLVLERPENDLTFKPLYYRTSFICKTLTEIAKNIDQAGKDKTMITGVQNPWAHYRFDISNITSERLDVLLAAKRQGPNMTATNANLIKYTLCIMAVLDWWINDSSSPAYLSNPMKIYRVSGKDGGPIFSVPVRNDQKILFAENIKSMARKKAEGTPSIGQ